MIDGKFFWSVKNDERTYYNIRKIATGQRNDYTTDCLLGYVYFKNYYKMIAINLGKQQALGVDPKAIQQINLIAILDQAGQTAMYFIIEEVKEIVLEISRRPLEYYNFILV